MKNKIQIIVASVLAAMTMGAQAGSIPGMSSSVFEFDGTTPTSGLGFNAVSNVNNILDSVGTSGGSAINTDFFWNSFAKAERETTFNYAVAGEMIDELIFTMTGEVYVGNGGTGEDMYGYALASDSGLLSNTKAKTSAVEQIATQSDVDNGLATNVGDTFQGNWLDGQIEASAIAGINLLGELGFNSGDTSAFATGFGSYASTGSVTDGTVDVTITAAYDPLTIVDTTETNTAKAAIQSAGFLDRVTAASIKDPQAFVNANKLIDMIAAEVKKGYLLDISAATEAVDTIIDHHNGFLSHSIIKEATSLRDIIKNLGYQTAATGVAKGAVQACEGSTSIDKACLAVGIKIHNISTKIDFGIDEADYNSALNAMVIFADNLNSFNIVASGYNAVDTTDAIDGQFGVIMVKKSSDISVSLDAGNGNPYQPSSWTNENDSDWDISFDSSYFDANIEIAVGTDENGNDITSSVNLH